MPRSIPPKPPREVVHDRHVRSYPRQVLSEPRRRRAPGPLYRSSLALKCPSHDGARRSRDRNEARKDGRKRIPAGACSTRRLAVAPARPDLAVQATISASFSFKFHN